MSLNSNPGCSAFKTMLNSAILNFRPIQNAGQFFEHLGWFKMGQNP